MDNRAGLRFPALQREDNLRIGRPDSRNPAADLSDLRVEIDRHEDGTASLRLHLLFGTAEIPLEDRMFEASAKQAILRMRCEGIEIMQGSRYGEYVRPNSTKTATTISETRTSKAQASGSSTIAVDVKDPKSIGGNLSATASAQKESERKATTTGSHEEEKLRVEALGGDRWRITETDGTSRLRGTYVNDEAICKVRSIERANRQRIEVTVEIRQRDLVFEPNPGRFAMPLVRNTNREKLLGVMMAKSVHEAVGDGRLYDGILVASATFCETDER